VALNLSGAPASVAGARGRVAIGSDRTRDGAAVDGMELGPWEAVVIAG
jgi:hypothetical protein